jgi:hypothetical protein
MECAWSYDRLNLIIFHTSTEHSNSTYNNHNHVDLECVLHPGFDILAFKNLSLYFLKWNMHGVVIG